MIEAAILIIVAAEAGIAAQVWLWINEFGLGSALVHWAVLLVT